MQEIKITAATIKGLIEIMLLKVIKDGVHCISEIRNKVKEMSGYNIAQTTVFYALERMESDGYLFRYENKDRETKSRKRSKKYYEITDKGNDRYKFKCLEWAATQELISKFTEKDDT